MTNVYEFRIAFCSEDELPVQEQVDPWTLTKTTLDSGQPNFKSVYGKGATEEEAFEKVEAYVQSTLYKDIKDGILL